MNCVIYDLLVKDIITISVRPAVFLLFYFFVTPSVLADGQELVLAACSLLSPALGLILAPLQSSLVIFCRPQPCLREWLRRGDCLDAARSR